MTTVEPLDRFYEAEKYHQQFYARNSTGMYCQYVIDPKLAKLRGKFPEQIRQLGWSQTFAIRRRY